jgi:hypothetical protein
MKCPLCDKEMRKVRWEITNNFKMTDDFVEYDKVTYQCKEDDVWLTTEIPMVQPTAKNKKPK